MKKNKNPRIYQRVGSFTNINMPQKVPFKFKFKVGKKFVTRKREVEVSNHPLLKIFLGFKPEKVLLTRFNQTSTIPWLQMNDGFAVNLEHCGVMGTQVYYFAWGNKETTK